MAIPISYNIRNLRLRKGLTVMTALGIALTVTTAIFLMALVAGLDRAFVSSGSNLNVLVLRKGSEAELSGGFDATLFPTLKTLPGIAKDSHGEPMTSVFDAGGSAYESEVWGDVNQMASDFDRQGGFASAYLRATDPVSAEALKNRVSDDQRLKLEGMLENEYYAKQTSSGTPIKVIGWVVGVIMAIGSIFAAMNTMYAAVAYRGREIATLRVIGFSRPAILTSFVLESLLLALLGALVGILLMLPFNGMQTGTSNAVTFSEVVFALRITPAVASRAIIFALIMGFVGGLAPAWHAARQNILAALRG